jgi:hypothetical protein
MYVSAKVSAAVCALTEGLSETQANKEAVNINAKKKTPQEPRIPDFVFKPFCSFTLEIARASV